VNGCQTSHVLFNNKSENISEVYIPIRLIETEQEEIRDSIIKATNSQNVVMPEEFESLKTFHKNLETFFDSNPSDEAKRLYYERRTQQYSYRDDIEKSKIVSIDQLIRSFASMFLDEPHTAGRYPRSLLKDSGGRMFLESHHPIVYYTSAYTLYKIEQAFRKNIIDRAYRKLK
jgi:hypothetical protein